MRDFWAGVYIALQNFEAKYSTLVYILFFGFIALLLVISLIKTARASAQHGKKVELREQKSDDRLKAHASQTLRRIIKQKTVTNNYAAMQELFNYLREAYPLFFKEASLKVVDNGVVFCLYGKKRTENPVLLCAHLDVVPEGDGWEHDAFDGTREDGKIYGRGALDCKGPAVAMFEALEKLVSDEQRPDRDVYLALGLDEESAGAGSLNIARYFEEQGISFDLILGEGGYIAKSHLDNRNYPIALIGVGERESCIFKITAEGKNGHSGRAVGRSAANVLAEALCRIETAGKRFSFTPIAESYLRDSLPAMGFKKRFVIANLPYTKCLIKRAFYDDLEAMAMMQSTVTPTQLLGSAAPNMLSNTAEAVLNAYLLPSEDRRKMLDYIKKLLLDLPVKIELTDANTQYKITSSEHPLYKLLCDTLRERFSGLPCTAYLSTGCSNVRHYAAFSDCVITFSPIVMEKKTAFSAHGANERISEESLAAAAEVYARFLLKL